MEKKSFMNSQEMLEELKQREILGMFDDELSDHIHKQIEKKAEVFDAEKRLKAAKSMDDLSKIYITH